jgi:hypothetical protein
MARMSAQETTAGAHLLGGRLDGLFDIFSPLELKLGMPSSR